MVLKANGSKGGCKNSLNITYRQQKKVNLCLSKLKERMEGIQIQKYLSDEDFSSGRFCRAVNHRSRPHVKIPPCPVNKVLFYPFLGMKQMCARERILEEHAFARNLAGQGRGNSNAIDGTDGI